MDVFFNVKAPPSQRPEHVRSRLQEQRMQTFVALRDNFSFPARIASGTALDEIKLRLHYALRSLDAGADFEAREALEAWRLKHGVHDSLVCVCMCRCVYVDVLAVCVARSRSSSSGRAASSTTSTSATAARNSRTRW